MVDDVINSLENMKLTTEEEEVIVVNDEKGRRRLKAVSRVYLGNFLRANPSTRGWLIIL